MSQFESQFGSVSATVQGLLVSSIIATAALSSMGSGALSDRISRTYTISLGAFVFSVGCAVACSAKALPQLFIGRGGTVIAGCMLMMGSLYASGGAQTRAGQRTLLALIYIFISAFVASWAIVIRLIASEMQPKRTCAPATSLAQCVSWAVNWVVAFSTPLFLTRSTSGPYFMFGGCTLLTVVVCAALQPETKGLSLDALDEGFGETKLQSMVKRYFGSKSTSGQSTGVELVAM
ncbi:hypothetical protein DFH09DRAFT_1493472 [Mycena vulgaris]|nr:hypothetical protein DFH09DRAFT_1493472 [Mycena vulgaris]